MADELSDLIVRSLTILDLRPVQDAYAARNPWQVIERAGAESGRDPRAVATFRSRAECGKRILDVVADNCFAWVDESRPLFVESVPPATEALLVSYARCVLGP